MLEPMPVDISAAPEIAFVGGLLDLPRPAASAGTRPTVGALAGLVRDVAARPQDWWHLVRFGGPARIGLDAGATGAERWLVGWPPGHRATYADDGAGLGAGGGPADGAGPEVLTVVAGVLEEHTITPEGAVVRPLRQGRIRVHSQGHLYELANPGPTYAVSLHAAPTRRSHAD